MTEKQLVQEINKAAQELRLWENAQKYVDRFHEEDDGAIRRQIDVTEARLSKYGRRLLKFRTWA